MKFLVRDPNTDDVFEVPEYISNAVLKQYIERKYTVSLALGCAIIGFLLGVLAYAL
jgi:hypothetical protein